MKPDEEWPQIRRGQTIATRRVMQRTGGPGGWCTLIDEEAEPIQPWRREQVEEWIRNGTRGREQHDA